MWRPWEAGGKGNRKMINGKGQWEVGKEAWGLLELVWPKPGITSSFFIFIFLRGRGSISKILIEAV